MDAAQLQTPYGGSLVNLLVAEDERDRLTRQAKELPSVTLDEGAMHDLMLLAVGAFSPLDRFMGQGDYESVLTTGQLADGTVFPVPITLPAPADAPLSLDRDVALRTRRNRLLGILTVTEIFRWDKAAYQRAILGTQTPAHPQMATLQRWGDLFISGPLRVLQLPPTYDFPDYRLTPQQTRTQLAAMGRSQVLVFQSRHIMHRAQEALLKQAQYDFDASLLLQPLVGRSAPDDTDTYTRVRAYATLHTQHFDAQTTQLTLLPLEKRSYGNRETLWRAIIARNYGGTHFVTQDKTEALKTQLVSVGMQTLPYDEWVYLPELDDYADVTTVSQDQQQVRLSHAAMQRGYLDKGKRLPTWFMRPRVAEILAQVFPPKDQRGFCVWFTGLSGSGKSTVASILEALLHAQGRRVTLLDGSIVRTHLSKGLGFSKADRDTNIRRIGFVAAEIVRHGGAVICAAISPYQATRADVRAMVGAGFVEVFVDTPLDICEQRDTKGLYVRARRGQIRGFTGIDDPYEAPENPDIHLDTVSMSAQESAQQVLDYLLTEGYLVSLEGDSAT